MDYHARNISQDEIIRMHVDTFEFRDMEEKWTHFKETCNIRICLVVDGVNPFAKMRSVYMTWNIFVINNNIPPWLSISRPNPT